MIRRVSCVAALAASAAVVIPQIVPSVGQLQARATLQVIASGLANPRGLAFGPEGGLYVAEAGSGGDGPCITGGNGQTVCYGPTGGVTRITLGATVTATRIISGLPSLATGGASATGPHDVEFQGRGNGYVTIGLGNDPAVRSFLGAAGPNFGRLLRFQPNGKYAFQEDLAGYEAYANPDGVVPDSNPYGLLALPGRQVYVDAGGNALNAVAANGSISTLGVFPDGTVGEVPYQAVPTSVAVGPDGAFYVGQLTGVPFPPGAANVYRIPANGAWRMSLRVKRVDPKQPVELRAFLQSSTHALTETWTSIIQPD